MEIEKKVNNIVQLLFQAEQSKVLPQKIRTALIDRISTLSFILSESKLEYLKEVYKNMLDQVFTELETNLQALTQGGSSFISRIYNWLPGSNLSKIQALIPKLLDLSDKIATNISFQKYVEHTINTKRKANKPAEDDVDEESDELKAASQGYKKVKTNEDPIEANPSGISSTSTNKIVNRTPNEHPFSIKMICSSDLDPYIPAQSRIKYPSEAVKGPEAVLTIRREEFAHLPKMAVLRLSKDHVSVAAKLNGENMSYRLTDLSSNGVYFMGNRIEGSYPKKLPERLKKETPYSVRNGDIFGILMNKDTENKDMLLGFEFIQG